MVKWSAAAVGEIQADPNGLIPGGNRLCPQIVFGNGFAAFVENFQCPDDPTGIALRALRCFRIDGAQLCKQSFHTFDLHLCFQPLPMAGGRDRRKIIATDQAVHIKACAAGDNGGFAPSQNVIHDGRGHVCVAADGEILRRVADIDHVMGDALHFFLGWLGGADIHAAIDLHGIAGNPYRS